MAQLFSGKNKLRLPFLLLILLSGSSPLLAQKDSVEKIFAFKITGYIKPLTDSSVAVQVLKPASFPAVIKDNQLGVLYHCYETGSELDTAMVGWGRCNLIKGDYYYFGIRLKKMQQPSEGSIIYLRVKIPYVHDGLLLNVMNHAIQFTNVFGDNFMNSNSIFTNTKKDEQNILDSMLSDIRYTANAMFQQMPQQNQLIKEGIYKGQKLFTAMLYAKQNELELFLKYIMARPKNYAGNNWKISEIFATWIVGGTPTVVENEN
jgi:hypothetical protein